MPTSGPFWALTPRLRAACEPFPVVLGYLFGSHARGRADAQSDIDVAVLANPSLSKAERWDLRCRLCVAAADSLHVPIEIIDVVVLQDAPILLQCNVIRSGRVFLSHDRHTRLAYVLDVRRRYEDESPALTREADVVLERILSHGS